MSSFMLLAHLGRAFAATWSQPTVAPSPLLDETTFIASLRDTCGAALAGTAGPIDEAWEFERCDSQFLWEIGSFSVRVLGGDVASRTSSLTDSQVAETTSRDRLVFVALGFDEAEADIVKTVELAAEDRDIVSHESLGVRFLGTKTFFQRTIDGVPVDGHRVVISRDAAGEVRAIVGTWPDLSETLLLSPLSATAPDEADLEILLGEPVRSQRSVVLIRGVAAGFVESAALLQEVSLDPDDEVAEKVRSVYLMDGARFNPLEVTSWL